MRIFLPPLHLSMSTHCRLSNLRPLFLLSAAMRCHLALPLGVGCDRAHAPKPRGYQSLLDPYMIPYKDVFGRSAGWLLPSNSFLCKRWICSAYLPSSIHLTFGFVPTIATRWSPPTFVRPDHATTVRVQSVLPPGAYAVQLAVPPGDGLLHARAFAVAVPFPQPLDLPTANTV